MSTCSPSNVFSPSGHHSPTQHTGINIPGRPLPAVQLETSQEPRQQKEDAETKRRPARPGGKTAHLTASCRANLWSHTCQLSCHPVVPLQPGNDVLQCHQAGGRQHAHLPHASSQGLPQPLGLPDRGERQRNTDELTRERTEKSDSGTRLLSADAELHVLNPRPSMCHPSPGPQAGHGRRLGFKLQHNMAMKRVSGAVSTPAQTFLMNSCVPTITLPTGAPTPLDKHSCMAQTQGQVVRAQKESAIECRGLGMRGCCACS